MRRPCAYCEGTGFIGGPTVIVMHPPDGYAPTVLTRVVQNTPDDAALEGKAFAEFLLEYSPPMYLCALRQVLNDN